MPLVVKGFYRKDHCRGSILGTVASRIMVGGMERKVVGVVVMILVDVVLETWIRRLNDRRETGKT